MLRAQPLLSAAPARAMTSASRSGAVRAAPTPLNTVLKISVGTGLALFMSPFMCKSGCA
jgi:hypothetical protein